ncbi:MAG: hypothetical protein QXZ55_03230, partial [Pyrobaculum sp.]
MPEQCREIRQVLEKLDEIEILLNTVLEELRELKRGRFEKQRGSFIDFLRERRYISITEIKSRQVLRQALEKGLVVVLKDEAANREIVVLKEVVRKLLERLPISIDDAERLEPR